MAAGMVNRQRRPVGRGIVVAPVHRLVEAFEAHRSAVRATMSGGLSQLTTLAEDPDAPGAVHPTLLEGSVQVLGSGPSPGTAEPER